MNDRVFNIAIQQDRFHMIPIPVMLPFLVQVADLRPDFYGGEQVRLKHCDGIIQANAPYCQLTGERQVVIDAECFEAGLKEGCFDQPPELRKAAVEIAKMVEAESSGSARSAEL